MVLGGALQSIALLKWPVTVTSAILIFGLSTTGTLSLVAEHADKMTKPISSSRSFNMPPTTQIGELRPLAVAASPATPLAPQQVALRQPLSEVSSGTTADMSMPAPTAPIASARIGNKAVNLRSAPSKNSASLGVLSAGTPVAVAGAEGGWLRVRSANGDGWVYSTYVDDAGAALPQKQIANVTIRGGANAPDAVPKGGKMVKAGSRIVVRDAPSSGAEGIYRLGVGEKIKIVERRGGWSRIETAAGESGWIRVN